MNTHVHRFDRQPPDRREDLIAMYAFDIRYPADYADLLTC